LLHYSKMPAGSLVGCVLYPCRFARLVGEDRLEFDPTSADIGNPITPQAACSSFAFQNR
jgi:hypothetical protein